MRIFGGDVKFKTDGTMKNFTDELLAQFSKQITDSVFCFIQNDRALLKKYLDLVAEKGLQLVNSHIAQAVAQQYGLTNSGVENKNPKSCLIQSYSELQ